MFIDNRLVITSPNAKRLPCLVAYEIITLKADLTFWVGTAPGNSNTQPCFSSGADESQSRAEAIALLVCKWALDDDHMGVRMLDEFT